MNLIKIYKFKIILLLILIILVTLNYPVLGAETVRKENYADPVIKVNNESYIFNESLIVLESGEKVEITYEIRPKTDEDCKIIDDRYYFIRTKLQKSELKIEITYKNGAVEYRYKPDLYIPDAEALDGVYSIVINLKGIVPSIFDRIAEMPIMEIKVQDSEGDPLCPVVVVVINTSKFMEDIKILRDKLKKLESEATSVVDVVNRYIKFALKNITLAESYYKNGEFIKADECLRYVERNLIKAEFEVKRAKAICKYEEVKKRISKVENLINKTESLIQNAKEKGKNVAVYDLKLSEIKIRYEHVIRSVIDMEQYLESEKFNEVIKLANRTLEDINLIIYNLTKLSSDLEKLVSENDINNNSIINVIKDKFLIIGGIIVGLTILFTVISKVRKRRKWDELK